MAGEIVEVSDLWPKAPNALLFTDYFEQAEELHRALNSGWKHTKTVDNGDGTYTHTFVSSTQEGQSHEQ